QTGHSLRILFHTILKNCHPPDPVELWTQFKQHFSDDPPLGYRAEAILNHEPTQKDLEDYALF
ncbi:hypothetical protein L218DRAFT_836057, partial [Marasmius fiardii PR-910]